MKDEELVELLRQKAANVSNIERMMAEDKSRRQTDNPEGRTDLYYWPTPEETVEGRAIAEITRLQARVAELEAGERENLERAIDRMGWPEIRAFQAELRRGQDIREDAGGYWLRCIKALFGIGRKDPVTTYQDAARALLNKGDASCLSARKE